MTVILPIEANRVSIHPRITISVSRHGGATGNENSQTKPTNRDTVTPRRRALRKDFDEQIQRAVKLENFVERSRFSTNDTTPASPQSIRSYTFADQSQFIRPFTSGPKAVALAPLTVSWPS
jgi:hypothetical protein